MQPPKLCTHHHKMLHANIIC